MNTVLVTSPGLHDEARHRLEAAGFEVRFAPNPGARSVDELIRLTNGAVAAIVSTDPFTREVFEASPHLELIARTGVGVDSIDMNAASDAGVQVITAPGLNISSCADHAIALMLALIRNVVANDARVRAGRWARGVDFAGGELTGSRVGLVGFGQIAQAVATRLKGFDCEIRFFDPHVERRDDLAHPMGRLGDLLAWAQIVSVHVPLTDATRRMIGSEELGRMGRSQLLINTSRGAVLDQDAVVEALSTGRLGGAGLDVFEDEPPELGELATLDSVVLSPHVAGLSDNALAAMLDHCVEQIVTRVGATTHPTKASRYTESQ